MPILAVIGIDLEGKQEILGFTTGDRENQQAWGDLLENLKERGVKTIDLWITDGGKATLAPHCVWCSAGVINAIENKFPTAKRQRCVRHKMENVLSYIPKSQHDLVYPELRAIFYQANREKAEQTAAAFFAKYGKLYPTATDCLQRDLDACLTFYQFPESHWRYIRTSNAIERLFQEVKKRSHKMAAAFRNENTVVCCYSMRSFAASNSEEFLCLLRLPLNPRFYTTLDILPLAPKLVCKDISLDIQIDLAQLLVECFRRMIGRSFVPGMLWGGV